MPQLIPLEAGVPFYQFSTTLDGEDFLFDVRWNTRDAAWYFDISTIDEVPISSGNKIALGASPGGRVASADFPAGLFVMLDTSGTGVDATFDDIGVRVQMFFYTSAEIDAL